MQNSGRFTTASSSRNGPTSAPCTSDQQRGADHRRSRHHGRRQCDGTAYAGFIHFYNHHRPRRARLVNPRRNPQHPHGQRPRLPQLTKRLTNSVVPVGRHDTRWTGEHGKCLLRGTRWTYRHPLYGQPIAHDPTVAGSNPAPASNETPGQGLCLSSQKEPLWRLRGGCLTVRRIIPVADRCMSGPTSRVEAPWRTRRPGRSYRRSGGSRGGEIGRLRRRLGGCRAVGLRVARARSGPRPEMVQEANRARGVALTPEVDGRPSTCSSSR
jgi:hypothetical protein